MKIVFRSNDRLCRILKMVNKYDRPITAISAGTCCTFLPKGYFNG